MRATRMILFLLPVFFFLLGPAQAQEPAAEEHRGGIVVHNSVVSDLPFAINNFTSAPADIALLAHREGARGGSIWVRTSSNGLYIAGKVDGEQPDFSHVKDQILSKDHVEVWLASTPNVDLPEIGWGDQFGDYTLAKGEESCGERAKQNGNTSANGELGRDCREWAATQVRYRPYFKRLFARQWLLTPDFAIESFAAPAYEEIEKRFSGLGDKVPEMLRPRGKPQMFLFPEQSGYSFEIFIPIDALPPLPTLRPNELYLLVDVFKAAPAGKKMGAYSTSSTTRVYGKPETFNHLRLDPPLYFALTPCDLPLVGTDKREGYHPAWFIPAAGPGQQVQDTFVVLNDTVGYRYEPAGLSPTARVTHYFWKSAGPNEWVCGPHLTHWEKGKSESFPYNISEDGFELKPLPDGHLLIKTGPRVWNSEIGSGQCGA
ncbi:MAG: hypothetical protein ACRD4H_11010, partial [Candidatus Acidiferrales bacterium]